MTGRPSPDLITRRGLDDDVPNAPGSRVKVVVAEWALPTIRASALAR